MLEQTNVVNPRDDPDQPEQNDLFNLISIIYELSNIEKIFTNKNYPHSLHICDS